MKQSRIERRHIGSWSQFTELVEGWLGFRNWGFRGQADARWPLRSSLSRHIEVSKVFRDAWPRQEQRIRRIFERKSHLHLSDPPTDDELEWLALMQHHGAPTRLLDLTWSPYVAAFFALERATENCAVWALNGPLLWHTYEKHRIDGVDVLRADPRDREAFKRFYLPSQYRFLWWGDPFRMPQRVVAQSGTFLVPGHLGLTVEQIIESYPGKGVLLVQFIFDTAKVRPAAMASLYSMNITQATLFPGLDGLARSMAYEFEYSWEVDLATNKPQQSLQNPYLPDHVLDTADSDGKPAPSALPSPLRETRRSRPQGRPLRRTTQTDI